MAVDCVTSLEYNNASFMAVPELIVSLPETNQTLDSLRAGTIEGHYVEHQDGTDISAGI